MSALAYLINREHDAWREDSAAPEMSLGRWIELALDHEEAERLEQIAVTARNREALIQRLIETAEYWDFDYDGDWDYRRDAERIVRALSTNVPAEHIGGASPA